eukprot:scaffold16368_cov73-Cyclotella_meneghiniana.AAC.11
MKENRPFSRPNMLGGILLRKMPSQGTQEIHGTKKTRKVGLGTNSWNKEKEEESQTRHHPLARHTLIP